MKDVLRKQYSVMKYVVGFAFNAVGDRVLLIRKNRPEWQKGRLNGVGGKVKTKENFLAAMVREFREKTGVDTSPLSWTLLQTLTGAEWTVAFFYTTLNIDRCYTTTDEVLAVVDPECLPGQCISNLYWLIPMALYHRRHPEEFKGGNNAH